MNEIEAYLLDCTWRGISDKTIDLYKRQLSSYQRYANGIGDKTTLVEYLAKIENVRTRHGYWRSIRAFVRWAARNGLCVDYTTGMRMRWIDAPPPQILSRDQVDALIESMPATIRGLRDRAILALMYYCGLRRNGVLTARRTGLDLKQRTMLVVTKGGRELAICIPVVAVRHLTLWLMRAPESSWVFPSLKYPDQHIDARQVSRTIHGLSGAEGMPKRIYCHLMRHSHACALADADVPLQVIQADLGHSSVTTTMRYLGSMQRSQKVARELDRVFG